MLSKQINVIFGSNNFPRPNTKFLQVLFFKKCIFQILNLVETPPILYSYVLMLQNHFGKLKIWNKQLLEWGLHRNLRNHENIPWKWHNSSHHGNLLLISTNLIDITKLQDIYWMEETYLDLREINEYCKISNIAHLNVTPARRKNPIIPALYSRFYSTFRRILLYKR